MNRHPFVATPKKGKCSSCGKSRADPIHALVTYNEAVAAIAAHHIEMAKQAFEDDPGDKTAMAEFITAFLGSDGLDDEIMVEVKKQLK